ncbi:MAG: hypothetical protein K8R69_10305 [Deltaproteobacteria bacterium]|nr:hypothetical protein [Deltaproteobacteria bacterium]
MAQAQIRPFDFTKIPKLSSRHLATVEGLLRFYPALAQGSELASGLKEAFDRDLGLALKIKFIGFEEASASGFFASSPDPTVLVLLKIQPSGQSAFMELDAAFCRLLVERVLGSNGNPVESPRSLTQVEEGALEFLLAKAVSQLKDEPSFQGPVAFRIARIVHEAKLLSDVVAPEEWGCVLKFYLGLEDLGGSVRVYLPHPLVEGVFLREDILTGDSGGEILEEHLDRVSHIKTLLWSEVGRVSLMASEKDQLENGDVILFDDTLAGMGPQGLTGKTILRVGEMPSEGLLAEVIDTEGKMVVKVLDFFGGE